MTEYSEAREKDPPVNYFKPSPFAKFKYLAVIGKFSKDQLVDFFNQDLKEEEEEEEESSDPREKAQSFIFDVRYKEYKVDSDFLFVNNQFSSSKEIFASIKNNYNFQVKKIDYSFHDNQGKIIFSGNKDFLPDDHRIIDHKYPIHQIVEDFSTGYLNAILTIHYYSIPPFASKNVIKSRYSISRD